MRNERPENTKEPSPSQKAVEKSHATPPLPSERQKGLLAVRSLLDQEIDCYYRVEQAMVEKKLCIIQGNAQQLMAVDQELLGLHQQLTRLEKDRMAEMVRIGQQNNTLISLIHGLNNSQDQAQFIEARQRLKSVVSSVQQLNDHNRQLLDLSLHSIQSSVDVIANLLAPEPAAYGPTGNKTGNKAIRKGAITAPTGASNKTNNRSSYNPLQGLGPAENRLPSSTLNTQG